MNVNKIMNLYCRTAERGCAKKRDHDGGGRHLERWR
jgi:hypothetical protein